MEGSSGSRTEPCPTTLTSTGWTPVLRSSFITNISLFRRKFAEQFTPSPRNNGHAKPTVLPRPALTPQKWPYRDQVRHGDQETQEEPSHWTYSPPAQEEIDSAMITHFSVRPAVSQDNHQVRLLRSCLTFSFFC